MHSVQVVIRSSEAVFIQNTSIVSSAPDSPISVPYDNVVWRCLIFLSELISTAIAFGYICREKHNFIWVR